MSTPYRVRDIAPGASSSDPRYLTAVGNTLFFVANDGSNGIELWKTDGTTTTRVADINPGAFSSNPKYLTAVGNTLFFVANDGSNGTELWKTDGTTTTSVADINPGAFSSNPKYLTAVGNTLFFSAKGGSSGTELWKTDGTTTTLVADIRPGSSSSNPASLTVVGATLYFVAIDSNGYELWKADGTTTSRVADINPGVFSSNPRNLTAVGNTLFFVAYNGSNGTELWKTDGTTTTLVADINPGLSDSNPAFLTSVGNTLFFRANDGSSGTELWKTDGTTTTRVADIVPGASGSNPKYLTAVGNTCFFQASDSSGRELWKTDGTTTSRVADIHPGFYTVPYYPGPKSSSPNYLTAAGNTLFFVANDRPRDRELWKSDGITTTRVADINPGGLSSNPRYLTAVGNTLFFRANDGSSGYELWALDTLPGITLPSITLAVSPAAVAEDGVTNLVYTFTRTGDTTSALIVSYTVAGAAVIGADYTGISATDTNQTVTFSSGSATATVTVDPTADSTIEADETVVLALAAGSGYTIGTTAAVVGTISNDDVPVITLAVSPATVTEDGSANLIYTFSRTGATTSALTVNYTAGGTATLVASGINPADYIIVGSTLTGTSRSVTFAAGTATATVTVDPTADSTMEADETVALTLAAGSGYTIGTTEAVVATISDLNEASTPYQLISTPIPLASPGRSHQEWRNMYAFAALRSDGSVVSWGDSSVGGDSSGVDFDGPANNLRVVGFANPFTDDRLVFTEPLPAITLAVSPAAVAEDGTSNLVYTFSRTGPTSSGLSVNYTVGGTATLGTDYTGIAATPATKTVSFAAGSATATLTIDPTVDTTIEPDETVALTLAASSGYIIGTTVAVVGTILNDDTAIEIQGNTKLLRRGDGKAFVEVGAGGTRREINSPSGVTAGSDSSEWQMVAAETIAGTNQILWRNNTANFLHLWTLDANWTWQSASGADAFNTPRAWELETIFQVDATRDGITGAPPTTLESQGNTKLLKRGDGKAFVEVGAGGTRREINSPSGVMVGSDSSEWQMVAAETIAGSNQILWRNNTANFLHLWSLDANWTWQSASGADGFNTPRAWELETTFQVDATRDGITGAPPTPLESQGNTKLLRRGDGKAFVEYGAGTRQEINSPSGVMVGSDSSEWQMVAAEMIAGVNQILWRNNTANYLHLWSLDANWTWQSSSGADAFNTPRAWELETIFQVDATRDGITGAPTTTLEAQGNTKLLKRSDGRAFVEVGTARQEITSPWGSQAGDDSSEWQMIAADTIGAVNQILWRNNTSSFLHIWSLDANWSLQSANGSDAFNSPRAWELETSFQIDATKDGLIGAPFTSSSL